MVSVKKIPRKSTRISKSQFRASTSSVAVDSPPNSPLITRPQQIGASRAQTTAELFDPGQSPLFMHNVDHPGLQLISLRLDGVNYDDWNAAMRITLEAKNKLGFIDGSLARPVESDSTFRL